MTQDFAKKPRLKRQSRTRKSQVPAWVWLFTGAILGIFVAFLAYLSGLAPSPAPDQIANTAPSTQKKASGKASGDTEKTPLPKPQFDFYRLLKESEVVIQAPPEKTTNDKHRSTKTPGAGNTDTKSSEIILQVGSFKSPKEADRLRAELILLNLDATVETATVRKGEVWHRVLVGPFTSSSALTRARSTLSKNLINSVLFKRKAKGA